MPRKIWFVVPAAGASRRLGGGIPKQYLQIAGCTVLEHALRALVSHPLLSGGVVVLAADDTGWERLPRALNGRVRTVAGGAERCHSVLAGLHALAEQADEADWVLVHDAARPCLADADLDRLIAACIDDDVGGLLAVPVADTLKRGGDDGRVMDTVPREGLWRAQTPQMFRLGRLAQALQGAIAAGVIPSDEAAAIELMGLRPRLVEGSSLNIKITHPADLACAASVLASQSHGSC